MRFGKPLVISPGTLRLLLWGVFWKIFCVSIISIMRMIYIVLGKCLRGTIVSKTCRQPCGMTELDRTFLQSVKFVFQIISRKRIVSNSNFRYCTSWFAIYLALSYMCPVCPSASHSTSRRPVVLRRSFSSDFFSLVASELGPGPGTGANRSCCHVYDIILARWLHTQMPR
jgi:hypothetical protein